MDRFCPKCGATGKNIINNLCEECFWKERAQNIPNDITVTLCSSCFSYLQGKRWVRKKNPESAALEGTINEIQRTVRLPSGTKVLKIDGSITEWNKNGLPKKIALEIALSADGTFHTVKREAQITYQLCNFCQGITDGKYEALVQIRSETGRLSEENRKAVELNIDQFYRKVVESDRLDITEIKEREWGIDIKFLTRSKAKLFAKKLSESTGAEVKESARLVGMDRRTGGRHYRTTISVKLPALKIGDLISLQDKVLMIVGYHTGNLVVEDLDGHKRRTLTRRSLIAVTKIDGENIKRVSIGSRSENSVTLLDLDENRFFELPSEKISGNLKEGDKGILVNVKGEERVFEYPRHKCVFLSQ